MLNTFTRRAAACLLSMVFAACSVVQNRAESLQTSLSEYEKALRWGQYDALPQLTAAAQIDRLARADLKNVQISRYEAHSLRLEKNRTRALQHVEIQYHRLDQMTVKTLTDEQVWEYQTKAGHWVRVNALPDFP